MLDVARSVLNDIEYRLFENYYRGLEGRVPSSADELAKELNLSSDKLGGILLKACTKVDRTIDMARRRGDPEISEVYKVSGPKEYVNVREFLADEGFDFENDPTRQRWRIIESEKDVGYYYAPGEEFRAFTGTRLETVLKKIQRS